MGTIGDYFRSLLRETSKLQVESFEIIGTILRLHRYISISTQVEEEVKFNNTIRHSTKIDDVFGWGVRYLVKLIWSKRHKRTTLKYSLHSQHNNNNKHPSTLVVGRLLAPRRRRKSFSISHLFYSRELALISVLNPAGPASRKKKPSKHKSSAVVSKKESVSATYNYIFESRLNWNIDSGGETVMASLVPLE